MKSSKRNHCIRIGAHEQITKVVYTAKFSLSPSKKSSWPSSSKSLRILLWCHLHLKQLWKNLVLQRTLPLFRLPQVTASSSRDVFSQSTLSHELRASCFFHHKMPRRHLHCWIVNTIGPTPKISHSSSKPAFDNILLSKKKLP